MRKPEMLYKHIIEIDERITHEGEILKELDIE